MLFKTFIKNNSSYFVSTNTNMEPSSIVVYPVSDCNLEGIKILVDNCRKMGSNNSNVKIATTDVSLWLGEFLDKYWTYISFVSSQSEFDILKIENGRIINRRYRVETVDLEEAQLHEFFESSKFKSLVLFSVIKEVDLLKLRTYYKIRYSDITEKYEERDKKIKEILT